MFKGIFGGKEKKTPEGYVPPSVPSLDSAGNVDSSKTLVADQYNSDPSSSAFSFISSAPAPESAVSSSSAFGFISESPAAASAQPLHSVTDLNSPSSLSNPTSQFSFIQDASPGPVPSSSGFAFIQDSSASAPAVTPSGFSFIQDAPAAAISSADVDSKILEENMRVAGLKKVVKKRSMARKPGQAAHDDDEPPASAAQKQPNPAVPEAVKMPTLVEHINQAVSTASSSVAALSNVSGQQQSEQPAFSFMASPAVVESSKLPAALPSFTESSAGNFSNTIPCIQQDSDGEISDGGGLDLDGMIIHEVVPDALPPPVHQVQAQQQFSSSSLQDWVELRDDSSGKMCVVSYFLPFLHILILS